MQTVSSEDIIKLGYCIGQTNAMSELGYPEEIIKEAQGPIAWIASKLPAAGRWLARGGVTLARAGAERAAAGGAGYTAKGLGSLQGFFGRGAAGVGRNLSSAGYAFGRNPWGTVGRGLLNYGKGAIFMGGRGIGGKLGKATFAGQMGKMMFGPGEAAAGRMVGGPAMGGYGGMGGGYMGMGGYAGAGNYMGTPGTNLWTNPHPWGY